MGLLHDVMQGDGAWLVDTDAFGETITYTPYNGDAKTITAVVFRRIPEPKQNRGDTMQKGFDRQLEIAIRNDSTYGVTSIIEDGDKVTLPENLGDTPKTFAVSKVVEQSAGLWRLRLR